MTNLPTDKNENAIPAVSLKPNGAQTIAVSGTTARNATAFTTRVITILATHDMYVELGDDSVEATTTTSHFIKKDIYHDIAIDNNGGQAWDDGRADTYTYTHIAAIMASGSGTLYISERE